MKDASGSLVQIIPQANVTVPSYTGATSSAAGTAGLVPAAQSSEREKFLRGDGTWQEASGGTSAPYQGATASASGVAGLVPAATSAQKDNYLKGDGTWGQITVPTVSNYVGATASASGTAGLVPAAQSSEREKFLCGDGTWQEASTAKEIKIVDAEPTSADVSALDNESLIFYEQNVAGTPTIPVTTTGNQTINGIKTFVSGIYGGVVTLTSGQNAFDLSLGACFIKTIASNTTFSFSNVPANACCCITVILTNAGNYTVTWPSSVKWTGNNTPTLTENGKDVLTFITADGGTTWFGTTTCIGVTA